MDQKRKARADLQPVLWECGALDLGGHPQGLFKAERALDSQFPSSLCRDQSSAPYPSGFYSAEPTKGQVGRPGVLSFALSS